MVSVTLWLLLLLVALMLVALLLRQSHQCSKLQEENSRLERDREHLTKEILILEATSRKLKESESDNSGLKEQLDEYKTKFQQSETVISGLKKQLDEYKTKFQQSEAVISGLEKQLEIKEEVVKSNNETQIQLQTDIDGLTKKVESLKQRLCETQEHVCRYLLEAAKSGDVNTVKVLFKCSNDSCTDDDEYRNTPLTYAAIEGHMEVVRVLLEGGANVDRANASRSTALHAAATFGHLDVCRLLLDWGAKVDPLDKWKDTPLQYAARWGHLSVVKLLVEEGADVRVKGVDGDTALHNAALDGHLSVVKLLVERGADVSVKNNRGQTASIAARSKGKIHVAEWLDSVRRG